MNISKETNEAQNIPCKKKKKKKKKKRKEKKPDIIFFLLLLLLMRSSMDNLVTIDVNVNLLKCDIYISNI